MLLLFASKKPNTKNLGEHLNHSRFADDIVLNAERLDDPQKILEAYMPFVTNSTKPFHNPCI